MKTTVQALLNVLLGRDPNEEILIENNQLRVVSTVDLLTTTPRQKLDDVLRTARPLAPTTKPAASVKAPKVENSKRGWKAAQLKTLLELKNSGASIESLAKVFGRTPKAIQIQLSHLRNPKPNPMTRNAIM